jgi:hypothetical protein
VERSHKRASKQVSAARIRRRLISSGEGDKMRH